MSASLLAAASREQMSYTVDALKTHLPEAVELLCDSALNPKLANHEVAKMAKDLKKEIEELKTNPQAMLMEAVHSTAYDGGLGNALLASQESIDAIDGDALREFIAENYVAPRMVLAASARITKSWCPSRVQCWRLSVKVRRRRRAKKFRRNIWAVTFE